MQLSVVCRFRSLSEVECVRACSCACVRRAGSRRRPALTLNEQRRRNLHTTLSCMLVYLAIHHAFLEGAGPCRNNGAHSPHLHSFWSTAPPEASIVHAVCLAEGHPNSPYIKRSKRDCGLRVSKCPKIIMMSAAPSILPKYVK